MIEAITIAVRMCSLMHGTDLKCESTAPTGDGRFVCEFSSRSNPDAPLRRWTFSEKELAQLEVEGRAK